MQFPLQIEARQRHQTRLASKTYLALVVFLLLVQLALRIHQPTQLPFYIDEYRHIHRAQLVYALEHNPIEFMHGKLLFYYWLGVFGPSGHTAVTLGRLSIALTSLSTSTVTAAIARKLFGLPASLIALVFYVFVPHTVFFERLAFADPFASALATLSVWQLLHFVESPNRRRALGLGVLISGAVLAKLTTALLVGLPVFAVAFLRKEIMVDRSRQGVSQWSEALWQRYGTGLKITLAICVLPWLVLLSLAILSLAIGDKPLLFPVRTVGIRFNTFDAIQYRAGVFIDILKSMLSLPMAVILAFSVPLLLRHAPRRTLFVVAWLVVLWAPSLVMTWQPETRYLVIGYPALGVLAGASSQLVIEAAPALARRRGVRWSTRTVRRLAGSAVAGGFAGWILLFALPFALKASWAPETLKLPHVETEILFRGPNGWAIESALAYLDVEAERMGARLPALGRFHAGNDDQDYCGLIALYVPETIDWACAVIPVDAETENAATTPHPIWADLALSAERWPVFYLVLDKDLPPPDTAGAPTTTQVFELQKPHDGPTVRVWRIESQVK